MNRTWPAYAGHGMLMFEDNIYTYGLTTMYEFSEIIDEIQARMSVLINDSKTLAMKSVFVGYGVVQFSEKPEVLSRPGFKSVYSEKYNMIMYTKSIRSDNKVMMYEYAYLQLLASILQRRFVVEGYTYNDYLALAWTILYLDGGIGSTDRPSELHRNADDIINQVMDFVGRESNEAFTFQWENLTEFRDYIILNAIRGLCTARIKADTKDVEFEFTSGDAPTAVAKLEKNMTADYDDFGNDSSLYFPMSQTLVRDGHYFPMALPEDETDTSIVNDIKRRASITGHVFTVGNIERGEIQELIFEPLQDKVAYVKFITSSNDGRLMTYRTRTDDVMIWRFRKTGWTNRVISSGGRDVQFLFRILTGGTSYLKHGYITDPELAVTQNPGIMRIIRSEPTITGRIVEKADNSNASKPQMTTPTTVIHAEQEKTNAYNPMVPNVNVRQPAYHPPATVDVSPADQIASEHRSEGDGHLDRGDRAAEVNQGE
jgi:hypothetical protein